MNAILVDDEIFALQELEYFIKQYDHFNIIGMYTNPLEAMNQIREQKPDVIFLDIEMPGIDGFNMAEEILGFDSRMKIVFATAFDEYAIKAFEINALDYILKPLTRERLDITVKKIKENTSKIDARNDSSQRLVIQQQALKRGFRKVPVWEDDRILLISTSDIFYYTVYGKDVTVIAKQGSSLKATHTLNYWETRLSAQKFFRCHRSYLVNMDKVEEIVPTFNYTYVLKLHGMGEELPVSRNCFANLKELLDL